jgi:hypothetical protein
MPTAQDVAWFKSQFQDAIVPAVAGTPFTVDMVTAIACQETGPIWSALRRKGLSTERILQLCVGDTLDATPTGGRRAFPKNKAELLASPNGARMFELARQGLVDMAAYIRGYSGMAARPDKFCHGFGIFQLDLQFFRTDPAYFLERHYADFGLAVKRCVGELRAALKRIGWEGKTSLSDHEMAAVAIAYNTGRYQPAKGLKQGHFDGAKFYGENFFAFLQLAHSVQVPASPAGPAPATRSARARPTLERAEAAEPPPAPRWRRSAAPHPTVKTTAAKTTAAKATAARKAAKAKPSAVKRPIVGKAATAVSPRLAAKKPRGRSGGATSA